MKPGMKLVQYQGSRCWGSGVGVGSVIKMEKRKHTSSVFSIDNGQYHGGPRQASCS